MAVGGVYSIGLSAVDNVSSRIDAINKRLRTMQRPVEQLNRRMRELSERTGLASLGRRLADLKNRTLEWGEALLRVIPIFGTLTGAASLAGMYRLVTSWSALGQSTLFAAQQIGISAGALAQFQGAARLAGVSSDAMTAGLENLGQTLYDAVGGRNPEAIVMLRTIGVSFRDAAGHAKSVAQVLPDVADRIARMRNPFAQKQVADALGIGALLPFLRLGRAGIERYLATAKKYGAITNEGAAAARRFEEQQTELSLSVEGLRNTIAERLAPVLGPMLIQLATWINTHRNLIATKLEEWLKRLGPWIEKLAAWLQSVDWDKFGNSAKTVVETIAAMYALFKGAQFVSFLANIASVAKAWVGVEAAAKAAAGAEEAAAGAGAAAGGGGLLGWLGKLLRVGGPIGAFLYTLLDPSSGNAGEHDFHRDGPLPDNGKWTPPPAQKPGLLDGLLDWLGINRMGGAGPAPPATGALADRQKQAMAFFESKGWSRAAAAGIVGNLQYESDGLNPYVSGDNGAAFGLAQWHSDRADDIEGHFGKRLADMSYSEQLAAVDWELRQGADSGARQAGGLLSNPNLSPAQAAAIVEGGYERPADDSSLPARASIAEQLYGAPAEVADPSSGGAAAPNGTAQIHVHVTGNTAGVHTSATASGGLWSGQPRVVTAMPAYSSP